MPPSPRTRPPLHRVTVLDAAVELADAEGIEAVSMRRLAERLGVVTCPWPRAWPSMMRASSQAMP